MELDYQWARYLLDYHGWLVAVLLPQYSSDQRVTARMANIWLSI